MVISNHLDLAGEVEMLENQLQMSEMRNRHLQAQLDRSPQKQNWQEDSPSLRRMQKLERENFRLHDMLDDSAKQVSALESSIRTGQLTLKEVQTKSHEELYDLINSQEQSRKSIVQAHNSAVNELADAKTAFDELKNVRAGLEVELRDTRSELQDLKYEREQENANHSQLLQEFSDLQVRLDTETSNLLDVSSSLNLYKARADEYFSKLEQAEIAVLKATRAEQFAKSQARETEETCARIMSERKTMDSQVEDLQRQVQRYEERVEDLSADLEGAMQAKKRLQNELEDYRSQRAHDIEDKETIFEQARKKYQNELTALSNELEIERENVVYHREENGRLREEIEELRSKWDDEVLNSSTWAKEKGRLEVMLQELSTSRDEAVAAHNEAQSKIVNLLGQVRSLRTNVDDTASERDILLKEKKSLESRLKEQQERLEDLMKGESPSMRNAAAADRDLLELKASLAQQEDIVAAAVGKMRRAEVLAQETQKDIQAERENNVQLHKEKAGLEKSVKDLQIRIVDLETKGYSSASGDVRFLNERIKEVSSNS
jgi:myosin protein heavy chain